MPLIPLSADLIEVLEVGQSSTLKDIMPVMKNLIRLAVNNKVHDG